MRYPILLSLLPLAAGLAACGGGDDDEATPVEQPAYLTASQVETIDGGSTFVTPTKALPSGTLDLGASLEIPGFAQIQAHDGSVYITTNRFTITRYEVGDTLEAKETINLSDQGFVTIDQSMFLSNERAFVVNSDQFEILEWNPTKMTVTGKTSIAGFKRPDWGYEYRGGFVRASDRTIFLYWAYTNERQTFLNEFIVGVYKIDTGALTILDEPTCAATAGFGGFFDEQGDLYLISDSFGGFTRFGGYPDPKDACVLRIKAGENTFDSSYRFLPATAMNGFEPWGFYYAGNGIAYTTGVDPSKQGEYPSLYDFIFAPIHAGFTLDLKTSTATKLDNVPPDGVGFGSVTVGDQLLIPRSTGKVVFDTVENVNTAVYNLSGATRTAVSQFSTPGYLGNVLRIR